jgi:hypothetical protein
LDQEGLKEEEFPVFCVNTLTFSSEMDVLYYSDQYALVRSIKKSLANIIKQNSYGYKAVEYEDPKSLPFFSFKPYKKKQDAKA